MLKVVPVWGGGSDFTRAGSICGLAGLLFLLMIFFTFFSVGAATSWPLVVASARFCDSSSCVETSCLSRTSDIAIEMDGNRRLEAGLLVIYGIFATG